MVVLQWTVSILLIGLSLFIGLGQWWAIYTIPKGLNAQGQPRNYSMIPFIGGVLGVLGCLMSPSEKIFRLWWLPLLIDPGSGLLFGFLGASLVVATYKRMRG